ncbi:MAG TPA: VacJ family lipoprotein [Woeseiaceae bacterium]|nr:VacJ family lipoprotein [Woeseiaceae bacterium]
MRQSLLPLIACSLGLALAGCAASDTRDTEESEAAIDPFESFNRKMYALNMSVDKVALKPIAKGYKRFVPSPMRRGFANIFTNFRAPGSAVNNFLQGKPKRGFNELGRFLFNSTLGIGGIFDVATAGGMERHEENFSQTLAVWGLPEGPYLVLPVLGPHSLLDAAGVPLDYYADLNTHLTAGVKDRLYLFRLVDARARLLAADTLLDSSNDPYVTLREAYLQNREFAVYDGEPPEDPDFLEEELFEDFFEDDD